MDDRVDRRSVIAGAAVVILTPSAVWGKPRLLGLVLTDLKAAVPERAEKSMAAFQSNILSFDELHRLAEEVQRSQRFALDIGALATEAIEPFRRVLGSTTLSLRRASVAVLGVDEIVLRGSIRLGVQLECELRFYREGQRIGYTLTFATGNPLRLLGGDLRRIADIVEIEALWWTASSRAVQAASIAIRNFEATALRVREGFDNFHLRLNNRVLAALDLDEAIFEVSLLNSVPSFSTTLNREFALPPVLRARFGRMTIEANGSVSFDAEVQLRLLGSELPPIPVPIVFAPDRVAVRLPVPIPLEMPTELPFRTISLRDTHVEIEGRLSAGTYAYGVDGRFVLPGTGHGGTYRFMYTAGNATPIPDMIELTAETLTVSDALNLLSPVPAVLPESLDSVVTVRNAYLYYAGVPGARSADNIPLEQGSSLRASVQIFGQAGYVAADTRPGGVIVAILTNPLRIGNILALRGTGVMTPRQYRGPRFDRDAIELRVDTQAGTARTALQVDFLGSPVQRVEAALERGTLALRTRTRIASIEDLRLEIAAGAASASLKGAFDFSTDVDLPLMYGFSLQGLGQIQGEVNVEQAYGRPPSASVTASLTVVGFQVETSFDIDPADISRLAERVIQRLLQKARELLDQAVNFVKAFLEGAVKYTLAAAKALAALATALAERFKATAARVVEIMKDAGATAMQALDVVREGAAAFGQFAYGKVVEALRTYFPSEAVLGAMRHWAEQFGATVADFAENVAWLLRQGGYAVEVIAAEVWRYAQRLERKFEAFVSGLAWGGFRADQVAAQLKNLQIPVDEAGRLIGRIFGTDILRAALTPAYGASEAARVTGNVVREMTRFGRDVVKEVRRSACRRFKICL